MSTGYEWEATGFSFFYIPMLVPPREIGIRHTRGRVVSYPACDRVRVTGVVIFHQLPPPLAIEERHVLCRLYPLDYHFSKHNYHVLERRDRACSRLYSVIHRRWLG